MKGIGLAACAVAALLAAVPCAAASEKAFTATETFCYSCICPTCDPGIMSTMPDGTLQLRNREGVYFYTASDSRAAGYMRLVINADTDASFNGTMWGTLYSCDASGYRIPDGWEGSFSGRIYGAAPANWIIKTSARGSGANSGIRMESTTAYGDSMTGTIIGVIQEENK
jgi:hypothetical protein